MLTAHVITWGKLPEQFYGNTLVFESIRTGFPTAKIVVIDNCSPPPAKAALAQLAQSVGASFVPLQAEMRHWEILDAIALRNPVENNAICFVDPDVAFWASVENWKFDRLMAGRLIPEFRDEYTDTLTVPRIHPSMVWFPDLVGLRAAVRKIQAQRFEFEPFRPVMVASHNGWQRWDTGAALSQAIPVQAFGADQLDCYDHLFCGTHASQVSVDNPRYQALHNSVRAGKRNFRGVWREQEKHFLERAA